jgi:translation elongation factor EF-1beta
MKLVEKVLLALALINLGMWTSAYWEKLTVSIFLGGVISLSIAYGIMYLIVMVCMDSYAKEMIKETIDYLQKEKQVKNIELGEVDFIPKFYQDISRQFRAYVLIGFILLDGFALYKFKFSMLSVINLLIMGGGSDE